MLNITKFMLSSFSVLMMIQTTFAMPKGFNDDESKVPMFTLPELLVSQSGVSIKTVADWEKTRRPEILSLFETQVFGKVPEGSFQLSFSEPKTDREALNGTAVRKQVSLILSKHGNSFSIPMLIYLPKQQKQSPCPIFVGYNFKGNHAIHSDPGIDLSQQWPKPNSTKQTQPVPRGAAASRWPIEKVLSSGYGVATIFYEDVDPDFYDGFKNGIHAIFSQDTSNPRPKDQWGSIATWAWVLSRAVDYFETDQEIDAHKTIVIGHSRLGKTALWAGANDTRFAITISNNSGCGGAALSRRRFGETVARINTSFPHWFNDQFKTYNDNENNLPIDQHMLIALMAPRPVYVASAEQDLWADPKGEYLSAYYAGPAYKLYGLSHLKSKEPAEIQTPVMTTIGYHKRYGVHDLTAYDWENYLKFADLHLKEK